MDLRITTPCPVTWESMAGDDRIRYCGHCKLNVYNLAILSPHEVERLVREKEGRLCGRLYMRGDRTATAEQCARSRVRQNLRRALTAAAVLMLTAFAWFLRSADAPPRTVHHPWVQTLLNWVDPEPPPRVLLGDICPTKTPTPSPTTPDQG